LELGCGQREYNIKQILTTFGRNKEWDDTPHPHNKKSPHKLHKDKPRLILKLPKDTKKEQKP